MSAKLSLLLALILSSILSSIGYAQIGPIGAIHVQQPTGVHYFFGTSGANAGGGFVYVNYLTGQYDIIAPVSVSSSGSFSATSQLTGRFLSGQVLETSISLSYNGATVSEAKLSYYGPVSAIDGSYSGVSTEPSLGVFFTTFVVYSDGVGLLISLNNSNVSVGVGTVSSSGAFSITTLLGEVVTGTFAPSYGFAQGSASSNFGYHYTYAVTKVIPPRLANISTRGFVGTGEQVLIAGFIVTDGGKTVLINAKGPSLSTQGISNPLANPKLDLYRNATIIASNGSWRNNSNASEISASGAGPSNDLEASLQVGLEPGAYTLSCPRKVAGQASDWSRSSA